MTHQPVPLPDWSDLLKAKDEQINRYRGALEAVLNETYPRPVAKTWRLDNKPSKHDRCGHGAYMYEPCAACLDSFITDTLHGEGK